MSVDDQRFVSDDCGGNAAPYVLGALTDAEHEAFSRHLGSCAVCREEVAALQTVAASLPASAPQVAAPPELKRRVMQEVEADSRRTRATEASSARERRSRTRARGRPALALGVALAAIVALVAVVAVGSGGSSEGSHVVSAQVLAPKASGSVFVSGTHAQLMLSGMPQVRPGRVYEVWVKRAAQPLPTDALFTVTGNGEATVAIPGSVAGVKEVLVTSEPLGGSRVPTTTPLVIAKLS